MATCGDPIITHADLDSAAGVISQSGIRRIDGNIVIDVSKFDSLEWGSGWMWDDEPDDYQMFISPACLDHNTIMVNVSFDSTTHRLSITTQPSTGFVHIVSTAVADTTDSLFVTRVMTSDTNTILGRGKYSSHLRPFESTYSVRYPAQYFGTVFDEMLAKHGTILHGEVLTEKETSKPERERDTLFTLEHSIDSVITYINKESDNLGAECLLRIVPSEIYGEIGSAENGVKLEEDYLAKCGIDSTEYYIVDGSGLSHYDLITPDAIVKLLRHNLDEPFKDVFLHSLPVAGKDGTLDKRMCGEFTKGKVLAKTGSISGVSTFSGYVLLPKDTLVFSMMMQNFITTGDSMRALQDSLCNVLVSYSGSYKTFVHNLRHHDIGSYGATHNRQPLHRRESYRRIRRRKKLPRGGQHK